MKKIKTILLTVMLVIPVAFISSCSTVDMKFLGLIDAKIEKEDKSVPEVVAYSPVLTKTSTGMYDAGSPGSIKITGRVTDLIKGGPVPFSIISFAVCKDEFDLYEQWTTFETNSAGEFTITGLRAGSYKIAAMKENFSSTMIECFELSDEIGLNERNLSITLNEL